jgi:flagellar motor switch protein FliM
VADMEDQTLDDDWAAALAEQSSGQVKAAGGADGGEASLADEWGAALAEQGGSNNTSDMAAEWAVMYH